MEEEPSLQALVKELASTVKTLQGEVSELRKEKDAPLRANKRSREDENVIEPQDDAESLVTRDGKVSEDDSGQSDAEGQYPKAYAVSAEGEAFLKRPLAQSLITPRDANT